MTPKPLKPPPPRTARDDRDLRWLALARIGEVLKRPRRVEPVPVAEIARREEVTPAEVRAGIKRAEKRNARVLAYAKAARERVSPRLEALIAEIRDRSTLPLPTNTNSNRQTDPTALERRKCP